MLLHMILALPFYIIVRMVFVKWRKRRVNSSREVLLVVFTLYVIGLASQTIIPHWQASIVTRAGVFDFSFQMTNELASVNLIPFQTLHLYFTLVNDYIDDWGSVSLINLIGNVILFSPIGFFVPYLWKTFRSFKRIILVGLSATVLIETIQYFIGRSSDIDDVLLNTFGVMIGYGLYFLFWKR